MSRMGSFMFSEFSSLTPYATHQNPITCGRTCLHAPIHNATMMQRNIAMS